MQPTNLTSLNFEDVKASIKSYLRTRTEFTDYEFEGSALSYLIDILAYNTYYSSFTANMLINESFIQSATLRSNIASLAKTLGYIPKSETASKVCIKLEVQTTVCSDGEYPGYVTLKPGPVLASGSFAFNLITERTAVVDNLGKAVFENMLLHEGTLLETEYIVDTFRRQRYVIPNENVDIDTVRITVKPNAQSTFIDSYNRSTDITTLDSTSRIYYINEGPDMRYEVFFGDGTIGRKLQDGEVITITYVATNAELANDITSLAYVGELEDSCGTVYDTDVIDITLLERSQFGSERESVESIKYNATRFYASQNRAVTTKDHETLVRKVYPNTAAATAYGGENLSPPVYGKVYIALRTTTGNKLNDATKADISKQMKRYTVGSLETVIVDPEYLYVNASIFVTYDQNKTALTNSEIQRKATEAADNFATQSGLNNFAGQFNITKLIRSVSLADPAIDAVSTQVTLLKYIETDPNSQNSHKIDFGTAILDSAPSNTDLVCDKEPVLQGGPFYTADLPSTPQYFEDDGKGNIFAYTQDAGDKVITNTNFGDVDYENGVVNVGPTNLVGDGSNPPEPIADDADTTDLNTITGPSGTGGGGGGEPTTYAITSDPLTIPVVAIPANSATILPTTPGTIMAFPTPDVVAAPTGTIPPPTTPLNNINTAPYITPPSVIPDVPPLTGIFDGGPLSGCF